MNGTDSDHKLYCTASEMSALVRLENNNPWGFWQRGGQVQCEGKNEERVCPLVTKCSRIAIINGIVDEKHGNMVPEDVHLLI